MKKDIHTITRTPNKHIEFLDVNNKIIAKEIAILTKEPHEINGFYTRLLVINREDFRIEKSGLHHSSGTFFKLDDSNYKLAKKFLNGK